MAKNPLHTETITITKAARLAVMLSLDDAGLLAGRSYQQVADAIGGGLNRSTVMRDKRLMWRVRKAYERARRKLDVGKLRLSKRGKP